MALKDKKNGLKQVHLAIVKTKNHTCSHEQMWQTKLFTEKNQNHSEHPNFCFYTYNRLNLIGLDYSTLQANLKPIRLV